NRRWSAAFVDAEGRRCSERRFLTLEHRQPFALGGPPTIDNICLLCAGHHSFTARQVFGDAFVASKRGERSHTLADAGAGARVLSALVGLGFERRQATRVVGEIMGQHAEASVESILRAAITTLTPRSAPRAHSP